MSIDFSKIKQATEALNLGYAITTDYSVTLGWLAWITSFFSRRFSSHEVKKQIESDIQQVKYSFDNIENLSTLVDFVKAYENSYKLNGELSQLLTGKIISFGSKLHVKSFSQDELISWGSLLNKLNTEESEKLAYTATATYINAHPPKRNKIEDSPEIEKGMMLFHNVRSDLIPGQPRFSTLLNAWAKFSKNTAFDLCFKIQSLLESVVETPFENFATQWQKTDLMIDFDNFQKSTDPKAKFYLPLFVVDQSDLFQTVVEITKNKSGDLILKDLSGRIKNDTIVPPLSEIELCRWMNWNYDCLHGRYSTIGSLPDFIKKGFGLEKAKPETSLNLEVSMSKVMKIFTNHLNAPAKVLLKLQHKMQCLQDIFETTPQWTDERSLRQWVKGTLSNIEKNIALYRQLNGNDSETVNRFHHRCQQLITLIESKESHASLRNIPAYSGTASDVKIELAMEKANPPPKLLASKDLDVVATTPLTTSTFTLPKEMPTFNVDHIPEGESLKKIKKPVKEDDIDEKSDEEIDQTQLKPDNDLQAEYLKQGAQLQAWVKVAEDAFKAKDFDALKKICSTFMNQLPTPDKASSFFERLDQRVNRNSMKFGNSFFKMFECSRFRYDRDTHTGYYFSDNLVNTWSLPLFRMAQFAAQCQFLSLGVNPKDLKCLLQSLSLQFRLSEIATTHDHHASFPVHTYSLPTILQGIQNYAANLGEDGGEILEVLKTFRQPHTIEDLNGKINEPWKEGHDQPIYNCTDQVASCTAYETLCFIDLLCNTISLTKDRLDGNNGPQYRMKNKEALEVYRQGIERLRNGELIRCLFDYNQRYSHTSYDILPFRGLHRHRFYSNGTLFKDNVGTAVTSFSHLCKPIQNKKIRDFIQQGLVATKNQLNQTGLGCDSDDFNIYQLPTAYETVQDIDSYWPNMHLGENKTQKAIYQEKEWLPGISSQCFQDLQMMQTSSLSRAENTLLTFKKYPDLLSHLEHGADFRTVFALNLFRDAALYREFCRQPKNIQDHFDVIDELIQHHEKANHYCEVLFLLDVRRQMLALLTTTQQQQKWDQTLLQGLQKTYSDKIGLLPTWWKQIQDKTAPTELQANKGVVCLHMLSEYARREEPLKNSDLTLAGELAVTAFMSDFFQETSSETEKMILDYLKNYSADFIKLINDQKGPGEFLSKFLPDEISNKEKWIKSNESTWKFGALTFYADRFQLIANNKIKGIVPQSIRNNKHLRLLDRQHQLSKTQTLSAVTIEGKKGWSFQFKSDGVDYQVYFSPLDTANLMIYRKKGDNALEQLVEVTSANGVELCQELKKALCWKNTETQQNSIEDSVGKVIYEEKNGEFLRLNNDGGSSYRVISPQVLGDKRQIFSHFAGDNAYELLKSDKGQVTLSYPQYKLKYQWNGKEKQWETESFEGFHLSDKPIESLVKRTSLEGGMEPLFSRSFEGYHLLENSLKPLEPKKLLIAPMQYQRLPGTMHKYDWNQSLVPDCDAFQQPETICSFDVDAEGQLTSKRSSDYIYLAYLLLTQRKYSDAIHYLKLGQSVIDYNPRLWRILSDWVASNQDTSPDAAAVRVRILFMEQQMRLYRKETLLETLDNDSNLPNLMVAFGDYQSKEKSVSPHLQLSSADKELLSLLEPRALTRDDKNTITKPSWAPISDITKKLIGQKFTQKDVIHQVLDNLLKTYSSQNNSKTTQIKIDMPEQGNIDTVDLSNYITHDLSTNPNVGSVVRELKELFKGKSYADEIGKNLYQDIEFYSSGKEQRLNPDANFASLQRKYQSLENKWLKQEKESKDKLFNLFRLPRLKSGEMTQAKLKEQLTTLEGLLDEARLCYFNQNWDSLVSKGTIDKSEVEAADSLMDKFLEQRIARKSWQRKKEAVEKYLKKNIHEDKLINIITAEQAYFSDTAEQRRLFKVIEDELNITIRDTQLSALIGQITTSNVFKHAGTGFGKTKLQRHLILRLKAMQKRLGGALTHSDLFQTHHQNLVETQNQAFGKTVYPFNFSREDVVDPYLMKQLKLQCSKAVVDGAILDHRKSDILSFKHRFTTCLLDDREFATVKEYQDVREFYQQNLSVNSDELISVLDPSKDHTFSYKDAHHLPEVLYTSCLDLFKLIKGDPSFKDLFESMKNNKLKHISDQAFSEWIDKIANKLLSTMKGVDQGLAAGYIKQEYLFTKDQKKAKEILDYYTNTIVNMPKEQKGPLESFHRHLEIFRQFRRKMLGVHFGRSKDQITTKPFFKSAKCMEKSQRSDLATTIFETCYDYSVFGVSNDKVLAYISVKQTEAKNENPSRPGESKVAKDLLQKYSISLFEKSFDKDLLKKTIDSHPDLLSDYLNIVYFKEYTYYPEKIEGNSCHIPNQYKEMGGSSGSAERADTLPYSIKKDPVLSRQKGDVGGVFYHLISQFDPKKHYLPIDPFKDIASQIGPHLKKGDVFVDTVPFFPGDTAKTIAEKLRQHCSDSTQNIRLINEEGKLTSLENEEIRHDTTGVLSHSNTEGTDWKFNDEIVAYSKDTSFTEFYQALSRARDLGKGQSAFVASDVNWEEIISQHPQLKGKSQVAQMIYLLAINEADSLKKLNYTRVIKDIRAVGENAIDNLLIATKDENALKAIKNLAEVQGFLIHNNKVDITSIGLPRVPVDPMTRLKDLAKLQKDKLETLLKNLESIACDKTIIKNAIALLDTLDTVTLPAQKLPVSVMGNINFDEEGIEDLEIEQEQQTDLEILQETGLGLDLDIAQQQEVEETLYKRKISDEGRENIVSPLEDPINHLLGNAANKKPNCFPLSISNGPTVYVSAHALGRPDGSTVNAESVGSFFWFGGSKDRAVLSTKIAFPTKGNKKVPTMISVKDSDLFMQPQTLKRNPLKEGEILEYGDSIVTKTKEGDCIVHRTVGKFDPKRWEDVDQFDILEWDLRRSGFPKWADDNDKAAIVLAKMMYLDCEFSPEDLKIAKEIIKALGDVKILKQSLQTYLDRNLPDSAKKHPLMALL